MGAASGMFELIVGLLAVRHGVLIPCRNLDKVGRRLPHAHGAARRN